MCIGKHKKGNNDEVKLSNEFFFIIKYNCDLICEREILYCLLYFTKQATSIYIRGYIVMSNGKSSCIKIFTHDKH